MSFFRDKPVCERISNTRGTGIATFWLYKCFQTGLVMLRSGFCWGQTSCSKRPCCYFPCIKVFITLISGAIVMQHIKVKKKFQDWVAWLGFHLGETCFIANHCPSTLRVCSYLYDYIQYIWKHLSTVQCLLGGKIADAPFVFCCYIHFYNSE